MRRILPFVQTKPVSALNKETAFKIDRSFGLFANLILK